MKRLLREPLAHFLLLGAGLFWLYLFVNETSVENADTIRITQGEISNLSSLFEKQWNRKPTEEEVDNLIQGHIREKVLYQEALNIGLEKNDTIIRRRLVQKMEFIFGDLGTLVAPDEQTLTDFHKENADKYQSQPRMTFNQIYINTGQRAADMLARLASLQPGDPELNAMGDRIMLPLRLQDATWKDVANQFGASFPQQLTEITPGQWSGPIKSGFGWHIVYVESLTPSRLVPLEQIRNTVLNDYQYQQRKQAELIAYESLKSKYEIILDTDAATN